MKHIVLVNGATTFGLITGYDLILIWTSIFFLSNSETLQRLMVLRQRFPSVPIMALTGTATPSVREDILDQLGTKENGFVLQSSYNRPNLWLQVIKRKNDLQSEVLQWIQDRSMENETGIIYCGSINEAEQLSEYLRVREKICKVMDWFNKWKLG